MRADWSMLLVFFLTVGFCMLILVTRDYHAQFTSDGHEGPQKVHKRQVPRIGGLALMVSLLTATFLQDKGNFSLQYLILISVMPVFLTGFVEDLTKNVSPLLRLIAAVLTGVLFLWMTDFRISRTNIEFLDQILDFAPIAAGLTLLSIAALINGINLIDGLNGLSLGTASFICAATAYIAAVHGAEELAHISLLMLAAFAGIYLFNFPAGHIFIGDGGAYLIGAVLSFLMIALPYALVAVSPFTSLLLIFYPLYELLRTIARRLGTGKFVMQPDNTHLHSLLFRAFQAKGFGGEKYANAFSSMCALSVAAVNCLWGVSFHGHTLTLVIGLIVSIFHYELIYLWARKAIRQQGQYPPFAN